LDVISETRYSQAMKEGYESLVSLLGADAGLADILYEKGFFSAEELSKASVEDLVQIRGIDRKKAEDLVESAKAVLAESIRAESMETSKDSELMNSGENQENVSEKNSQKDDPEALPESEKTQVEE
ncbi:MAG: helix-hairpin-helix domain-containing protein, partial [Thermodesulfobacteriota bacterium]